MTADSPNLIQSWLRSGITFSVSSFCLRWPVVLRCSAKSTQKREVGLCLLGTLDARSPVASVSQLVAKERGIGFVGLADAVQIIFEPGLHFASMVAKHGPDWAVTLFHNPLSGNS